MGGLLNFFKQTPKASKDVEASAKVENTQDKAARELIQAIQDNPKRVLTLSTGYESAITESLKKNHTLANTLFSSTLVKIKSIGNEINTMNNKINTMNNDIKSMNNRKKLKTENEITELKKIITELTASITSLESMNTLAKQYISTDIGETPTDSTATTPIIIAEAPIDSTATTSVPVLAKLTTVPTEAEVAQAVADNTKISVEAANVVFLKDFTEENILAKVLANNKDRKDIYYFNTSKLSQLPTIITTLTTAISHQMICHTSLSDVGILKLIFPR